MGGYLFPGAFFYDHFGGDAGVGFLGGLKCRYGLVALWAGVRGFFYDFRGDSGYVVGFEQLQMIGDLSGGVVLPPGQVQLLMPGGGYDLLGAPRCSVVVVRGAFLYYAILSKYGIFVRVIPVL